MWANPSPPSPPLGGQPGGANFPYPVSNRITGVNLSKDEIKIRQYFCSGCRWPSCDGILAVTNKRVIFHGHGKSFFGFPSRVVDEVPLDAVSGFSSFYGSKWRYWVLLLALLFLFSAIVSFAASQEMRYIEDEMIGAGFGSLVVSAILFIFSRKKSFFLRIYSSKASSAPIELGEGFNVFGAPAAVFALSAYPTQETDQMMVELGAMIGDLQKLGEHAYDRWKR